MILSTLDIVIVVAFLALSLAIGIYYNKKNQSIEDYFVGGRRIPWYVAGISMVATTFAADTPLAVTELVGQSGISGNWLWWSFLVGGMLTTFFFARLWRKSGVLTEVELIELRYSGKAASFLRGFKSLYLGVFINVLIIGWVNLAMIAILQVFFGLSTETATYYTIGAMLFAAFYSSLGGLWGVSVTDTVQFTIAMTGTIILSILVVNSPEIGGLSGLKSQLPADVFSFFPSIGTPAEGGQVLVVTLGAFLAYVGVQWWASWYPGAEPGGGGYVAQRMMSTRSEKESVYATLLFQVAHYAIRPWPWILVALCSLVLYPELQGAEQKQGFVMAMRDYLPTGLRGLLLVAFIAAYMSTISTQLNWGAGYVVNDFYKRFLAKEKSQKHLVMVSRLVTLLLMALAVYATSLMDSISGVWAFLIECGAGLGLVLILRWYWWRVNAWSEISATLAPFVGFAVSRYVLGWEFPNSFFLTVTFTTVVWLLVTRLTKPEKAETLAHFYQKVNPGGWWKPFQQKEERAASFSRMGYLAVGWIFATVFVYACLFFVGSLLFGDFAQKAIYLMAAVMSLLVVVYLIRSKGIFEDVK